jgi:hypothetical protein
MTNVQHAGWNKSMFTAYLIGLRCQMASMANKYKELIYTSCTIGSWVLTKSIRRENGAFDLKWRFIKLCTQFVTSTLYYGKMADPRF